MQPVGVGLRAVATIIDGVLLGIVGYAFSAMAGSTTATGFNLAGAPFFAWMLIAFGYYIVLEAQLGWTLGKRAVGIRVVKKDGSKLDWQASIVRNLVRIVDGLFFYLVAAIAVWTSKDKQRLGDRIANTLVVRGSAGGNP